MKKASHWVLSGRRFFSPTLYKSPENKTRYIMFLSDVKAATAELLSRQSQLPFLQALSAICWLSLLKFPSNENVPAAPPKGLLAQKRTEASRWIESLHLRVFWWQFNGWKTGKLFSVWGKKNPPLPTTHPQKMFPWCIRDTTLWCLVFPDTASSHPAGWI